MTKGKDGARGSGKPLRGPWPAAADLDSKAGGFEESSAEQDAPPAAAEGQATLGLSSSVLVDQAARDRVRESLDESLLVEAAAGTGKTTELIHRLVAVLKTGRATIDGIVAVTFTRKAAGELKLRLRQELDRARSATPDAGERRHLEHAVAHLEEARIGTIHSFCAEILRRLPVAAGVDPSFIELSEEEAPALHRVAFESWIQNRLADPSPDLRRALVHLAVSPFGGDSVLDRLRAASWGLADWRDFPAAWSRPDYDRGELMNLLVEGVERVAGWARLSVNRRDPLRRALEPVVTLQTWINRHGGWESGDAGPLLRDAGPASDASDELEARLVRLARDMKSGRPTKGAGRYAEGVAREQLWEARTKLLTGLETLKRVAQADLAATTKEELDGVIQAYERLKRARGSVDYSDLLLRARDLVRDDPVARSQLQASFSHLFVDEFQDTDPLQAELLMLLCSEDPACTDWRKSRPVAGKLFVVGDPKQSIYRFRRADIGLYSDVRELLERSGVASVFLTSSFRSTAPIQRLINASFGKVMNGDRSVGQPDYVPLHPVRESPPGQPSVVVLPPPYPYGTRYIARKSVEECQPSAAAAYVAWLVNESGWTVEDPEDRGARIAIRPDHVCLLFRRFISWGRETTREYTRALESRGLPHLLVGARTLHRREEVETLKSVLQAVEWPNDELALYATLRGSLFSFSDEALLRFRDHCGRLDAFQVARQRDALAEAGLADRRPGEGEPIRREPREGELGEIVAVMEFLLRLHRRRNHRPIVETVRHLLTETRAHAGFAMRPAGNQVLANVERVLDLARGYELGGGRSFRGFVERLEGEASRPRSSQPVVAEDGAPGVRLMTVHNAKGLEFPVVLLADMTANLCSREPDRTIDTEAGLSASRLLGWKPQDLIDREEAEHLRDESEGVRVAYVAATRARDLLIVPGVGDKPLEGWLSPLNQGIYPSAKAWRKSEGAAGCPAMGARSLVERPPEMEDGMESSVRPGLHRMGRKKDGYEVVWWDPNILALAVATRFGLRQEEILSEDEGAVEVERNLARYREWRDREEELRTAGGQPSVELVRVTELETPPPQSRSVVWSQTERNLDRPSGLRFGSLVHEVLQLAEELPHLPRQARSRPEVEGLVGQQARILQATEEEVAAAVIAVETACEHPLLRAARTSPRVCREMPFTLPLGVSSRRVLEGTIDLAYLSSDGSEWVVVDFKTDVDFREHAEAYERQVSWYCYALETLTGLQAKGHLLAV